MESKEKAGKGLYYLCLGTALALFSFVPFLGAVVGIVALALQLVGLIVAERAVKGYKMAIIFTIAQMFTNDIAEGNGILPYLAGFASIIFCALAIYYVCKTTGELLKGVNDETAALGGLIWKGVMICTVVELFCKILILIPILNIIAALLAIIVQIIQAVILILYIVYLWKSQAALQEA